jgi:UDP-N-acetylglucosamine acyltransferase
MGQVSHNAVVDPAAELAEDVRVGPFSYIGPEVRVESGCIIENNVTLTGRTTLGKGTHVFPLASVGTPPPGVRTGGECILGRGNAIREQVTIHAGGEGHGPTKIGDDNLFMIATQIGPGAHVGSHGIFANCMLIEAGAVVEDYVRASAFSVVQAGVRVGAYTFVAGFAVVDHDAPPFAMLQGAPYRIRGVNTHNLTRCGFAPEEVRSLKDAFRTLFDPSTSFADLTELGKLRELECPNPRVGQLLQALSGDVVGRGGGEDD